MPRNRHKTAEEKTLETLKKHLKGGEILIVGVSGGPDSVFLLNTLLKFNKELQKPTKIIVAHVNHSLRGKDAETDTKFTKDLAKTNDLIFECTKADTIALSQTTKSSIEEAGREIRYGFFLDLFKKYKANYVLTAHHADDNLETVLLNLIRGSMLKGISGMKITTTKRNGIKLLRPLLHTSKKEIRDHLTKNKIKFRLDSTNQDTSIPRNFLRLEIIPKLKELNPSIQKTILKNSQNIGIIQEFLSDEAKKWIKTQDPSKFDLKSLQKLPKPIQQEVLRNIYKKKEGNAKNISGANIEEVLEVLNKNIGRKQKSLGKYTVEIKKGTFILT